MAMNLIVCATPDDLAQQAADSFASCARAAQQERGRFITALAGGSTPRNLYRILAEPRPSDPVPWPATHIVWGDERCLPPENPRSNYHLADTALLRHVPIPAAQIHRVRGELAPVEAARAYEHELRQLLDPDADALIDLVLLGLGEDGHTASIFPGTAAVNDDRNWVVAHKIPTVEVSPWRITLTPVLLNRARRVLFLVSGQRKAAVLQRVLQGDHQPDHLPAQAVRPRGDITWLVDRAAASALGDHS